MVAVKFRCAHCRKIADRPTGHVNRSRAQGMKLFCGRTCFGLARRRNKSKALRVAEKRAYDMAYRKKNRALLKAKKAAYFQRTYDPTTAAVERKKRAPYHAEYCRRPTYRVWKQGYDRKRRAAVYGPASEAYMTLLDLNREIKERMTTYEIKIQNGTWAKKQARGREARAEEGTRDRHRPA